MAVNFLKRYIWLIDLINRRGYISFREISEAWSRSPLNDSGSALSERTFFNHKTAIEEMLGIEIKNDRTMGYYIRGEEVGDNATLNWMLHSLCMNNLFQENSDMKDRILVERQSVEIFRLVVNDTYEHILRRLIVPHDDSEEVLEILFRVELFR